MHQTINKKSKAKLKLKFLFQVRSETRILSRALDPRSPPRLQHSDLHPRFRWTTWNMHDGLPQHTLGNHRQSEAPSTKRPRRLQRHKHGKRESNSGASFDSSDVDIRAVCASEPGGLLSHGVWRFREEST